MKQTAMHIALLLVVAGGLFFTDLGGSRLFDRDEPRNAGCAAEMMARGDYIIPTFNDELRYQKPVLLYWFMMSAYAVFGMNEFSARFWSALFGIGTVLLTYGIGRRLFNPTTGMLAGIILASSLIFDVSARAATPDSLLIFFSTLALFTYVMGIFGPTEKYADETDGEEYETELEPRSEGSWFPQNWFVCAAMYAAMSMGVLAKGLVGILLPMSIIGMFVLICSLEPPKKAYWKNQGWLGRVVLTCVRPFQLMNFLRACWTLRPFTALLMLVLIAAPWFIVVGIKTGGDFPKLFFLTEHFGRATSTFEGHSGGVWYYPLAILLGFFPWSLLWGPIAIGVDRQISIKGEHRFALLFVLCWIGVQVGLFTLASTKLPSYVAPCYPALAMLTAFCLYQWCMGEFQASQKWFLMAFGATIVASLAVCGALGFLSYKFMPEKWWIVLLGLLPLAGGIAALVFALQDMNKTAVACFASLAVAFSLGLFGFGTRAISSTHNIQAMLNEINNTESNVCVASYGTMESSWVIYGQKPIHELDYSMEPNPDAMYNLGRENWWDPKPKLTPENFVQACPDAVFMTAAEYVDELKNRLPEDYQVIQTADYFLRDKQIVLLARQGSRIAQRNMQYVTGEQETIWE